MNALAIHNAFTIKVKNERKSIHEVLLGIIEFDQTKAYAELGYTSLYDYLTKEQKYSEGSAQRRITAARLLNEVPDVKSKLEEGSVNLTQLLKLSSAIKQEQKQTGVKISSLEKKEIIAKLENKTSLETEQILQKELGFEPQIKEKIVQKEDRVFITMSLSQNQFEKLQRAQNILSHKVHDKAYAGAIERMCDQVIKAQDGSKKRKAGQQEKQNAKEVSKEKKDQPHLKQESRDAKEEPSTATVAVNWEERHTRKWIMPKPSRINPRTFIPKSTRQMIFHRAGYCCEYVSRETGKRCGAEYQTQLDHIVPLARGGGNNPENLRVLCRTHNLAEARRWGLIQ